MSGEPVKEPSSEKPKLRKKTVAPPSFEIIHADDLEQGGEEDDLVEDFLLPGSSILVYGASNCGKTFIALDLAAHIASGKSWRGLQVEQGAVVYVGLEGGRGLQKRIEALKKAGILAAGAPLFICRDRISLLNPEHAEKLAQTVRMAAVRAKLPCKLVVLDTMARAMAAGDENRGEDMTAAIASMDAVRAATGAAVVAIHHSGKDVTRGARGHSSLRAAVDTEIEISKCEGTGVITARVTKQRDLEYGSPMAFKLVGVDLGLNRRDKMISSCVVEHLDSSRAGTSTAPGRPKKYDAEDLLAFLPAQSAQEWLRKASSEIGIGSTAFYRLKNDLWEAGKFRKEAVTNALISQ